MSLGITTHDQLIIEGIAVVDDLAEFEEKEFKQLVKSLRNPPKIPDLNNTEELVRVAPFVLNAKSLKRLKVAADAARYYNAIGHELTSGNMSWTNVMVKFELQWKSIIEKKKAIPPSVPKITRTFRVTKWSESFINFLNRTIGVHYVHHFYVIRTVADWVEPPPVLARYQTYCDKYGSVEGELLACLSHTSSIYQDDNAKVFDYLEEMTRETVVVVASLMSFQSWKDDIRAFFAVMSQNGTGRETQLSP